MAKGHDWGLEHISQLMLGRFLTCRQQYLYRYIRREKEPDALWMPSGTTFHNAAYDFHQHPETSVDDLLALAESYWDEEVDGREFYTHKGDRETPEDIEQMKQDVLRWLEQYVTAVKDGDFPFVVFDGPPERDASNPVEGTNHVARGYIDAFVKCLKDLPSGEVIDKCKDGRVHLLDFKLASKKFKAWNETKAAGELQATVYGYIMGKLPLAMHYIVVEKTASHQKPSLKHIVTYRDERDYEKLEALVKQFEQSTDRINKHKNGTFFPEPTFGWGRFCDKFCGFKDVCYEENFAHRVTGESLPMADDE